jgi:hypothetical protein
LSISNFGQDALAWQITEDCPWLAVSPTHGNLTSDPNLLEVSVDISGMAAGDYEFPLTIVAPGATNSPKTVPVTLKIIGPILELSISQYSFTTLQDRGAVPSQNLIVRNSGGGILDWQAAEDCPWLAISPASGSITDQEQTVSVSVDPAGMPWGTHHATVVFSAAGAQNSPTNVPVTFRVIGPILQRSVSAMTFEMAYGDPAPSPKSFAISNTGGGTLNWQIVEACDWLSVDPAAGQITTGSDTVTVQIYPEGLKPGTYSYTLIIHDPLSENLSQSIQVGLTITGPKIQLGYSTISMVAYQDEGKERSDIYPQYIRNNGLGTMDWTIEHDCSWLIASPLSGSHSGQPESNLVELAADLTGLNVGDYTCQVTVRAPDAMNNPQTFQVKLHYASTCYTGPDVDAWIALGRPRSWCNPYQRRGDADGKREVIGKGSFVVGYGDLQLLLAGFKQPYYGDPTAQPWIAADFDHQAETIGKGSFRVGYKDINIFLAYFKSSNVPPGE